MNETLKRVLRDWDKKYDERARLQHAYVAVAGAAVLAGGLISLFDNGLGQTIAKFGLAGLVIAGINMVFWGLINGLVMSRVQSRGRR